MITKCLYDFFYILTLNYIQVVNYEVDGFRESQATTKFNFYKHPTYVFNIHHQFDFNF